MHHSPLLVLVLVLLLTPRMLLLHLIHRRLHLLR